MNPYYQDEAVTLYHGDCRDLLPWPKADLLLTDPPYGVGWRPMQGHGGLYARNGHFAPIAGDDEPFDAALLLQHIHFGRCVLWGANHYADQLPPSPTWFVWDKREHFGGSPWLADCEMAWANTGGPARLFHHYWNGGITKSERSKKLHPTQKPVALMRWVLETVGQNTGTVLDPYMGCGPVGIAAKERGLRYIGIEIEERYCEIAARRLSQEVLAL